MNKRQLKKLDKIILKQYHWWDYSQLLSLMKLWVDNASVKHSKDGHLLSSGKKSKQMRVFGLVLERLIEDEYMLQECKVFKAKNIPFTNFTVGEVNFEMNPYINYENKLRDQDLALMSTLLQKHLLTWWD